MAQGLRIVAIWLAAISLFTEIGILSLHQGHHAAQELARIQTSDRILSEGGVCTVCATVRVQSDRLELGLVALSGADSVDRHRMVELSETGIRFLGRPRARAPPS